MNTVSLKTPQQLAEDFVNRDGAKVTVTETLRTMQEDHGFLTDFAQACIALIQEKNTDPISSSKLGALPTALKRATTVKDEDGNMMSQPLTFKLKAIKAGGTIPLRGKFTVQVIFAKKEIARTDGDKLMAHIGPMMAAAYAANDENALGIICKLLDSDTFMQMKGGQKKRADVRTQAQDLALMLRDARQRAEEGNEESEAQAA